MKVIIDSDLASVFAKVDQLSLLQHLFSPIELVITPRIREELVVPMEYGYEFPKIIFEAFSSIEPAPEEIRKYNVWTEGNIRLGKCELEAIAICSIRGYGFAAVNGSAREFAVKQGVNPISLHAILRRMWERAILNREVVMELISEIERVDRTKIRDTHLIFD